MAITTVADLLRKGFDFEVQQYLSGNVREGTTLWSLAVRTFGDQWQGDTATLVRFSGLVQEAMAAGESLTEEGLPPDVHPPSVPLGSESPEFRTTGYAESTVTPPGDALLAPNAHLPFQIDSGEIPTPGQILDSIRDNPHLAASSLETESPGLIKRLEELEFERQAGVNRQWEVHVQRIWQNIEHRFGA